MDESEYGNPQSANATSDGLAGLPAGSTKLIVRMIGQSEILNQASGLVAFWRRGCVVVGDRSIVTS